jgi:starch synthase
LILGDVFDLQQSDRDIVEYGGCINLIKGAIVSADIVSTVSPRYAQEICTSEYAHGLDAILNENSYKLCGILNGIDYRYYNPGTDNVIAKKYNWRSIAQKYENKKALQRELGLPEKEDAPMVTIISRLASHKGLDLISEIGYRLIENNDIQLVVLGKGEAGYERFFCDLENAFPNKVKALITYDRDLSKRIYSAADIFLMPSKSEPCGLSQMIASRYGAIPVTRETGGLYDSIKGYWEDGEKIMGNGFTFANYSSEELLDRTLAAIELWKDEVKRKKLITKIMRTDFSWKNSAVGYLNMYSTIL